MYEVINLDKRMTAFVIPNAIQVATRNAKYTFTSFLSRDTTYDVMYNVWRLARPEDSSISSQFSGRGSLDATLDGMEGQVVNGDVNGIAGEGGARVGNGGAVAGRKVNKVTQCVCGRAGQHFPEVAMESILPGTPEKIYNLMFTSGFIKDFMWDDQKLIGMSSLPFRSLFALPFGSSFFFFEWDWRLVLSRFSCSLSLIPPTLVSCRLWSGYGQLTHPTMILRYPDIRLDAPPRYPSPRPKHVLHQTPHRQHRSQTNQM